MGIGLLVIAIVLVAIWWLSFRRPAPQAPPPPPAAEAPDTTGAITQELDALQAEIGDLNKEFQSIDADLNTL